MQTAQLCRQVLDLCQAAVNVGNSAVMSDAGVGALMAFAGVQGAVHNVRINLSSINDEAFVSKMKTDLGELFAESKAICEAIQQQVEGSF